MGLLSNVKHEMFAQGIVRGTPITKAYVLAGYPANRGNAARLRCHEGVKARIAELQGQKTAAVEMAQLSAAEKAGVDHYWVVRTLRRNSVLAARRGDIAASNRAAELIGRHIGMFVERKSIEISYIDDADAYLQRLLELVGQPVLENEPLQLEQQPQQLEHDAEDGLVYGSGEPAEPKAIDIAAT